MKFSEDTSTGIDMVTFNAMKALPPSAKESLLRVFIRSLRYSALPTQALANLIALLGKKDGGTRCIAICATYYRLFLTMLGEEVREWDTKVAMEGDTALQGKSPLVETALRHLKVEAYAELGYSIAIILWDCLLYTSPSPRDGLLSRMPSSA